MPPKFLIAVVIAALVATITAAQADQSSHRIEVSAQGHVDVAPDQARINVGVTHEATVASAAMMQVNDTMAKTLADLRGLGIEDRHLQTTRISLNPVWSRPARDTGEMPQITGFRASNTVSVTVTDLSGLGVIMDAILANGVNNFNGLQFEVQNPDQVRSQARAQAVANARSKAQELADAAGVILGDVVRITEISGAHPMPVAREMAASFDSGAIASGEVTQSVAVSMVFAIAR